MASNIDQKEYLKRYLSGKDGRKKNKKKKVTAGARVKIIDDDLENNTIDLIEEDLYSANEDAPQIVAVIDERPPSMRVDESTKDSLWKPIGAADVKASCQGRLNINKFKLNKLTNEEHKACSSNSRNSSSKASLRESLDNSPRRRKIPDDGDILPPRNRSQRQSIDSSSPRPKIKIEPSSPQSSNRRLDDDISPPRRNGRFDSSPSKSIHIKSELQSPSRDSDNSPPRRIRKADDSDNSPPRRVKENSDISPIRKTDDSDNSPPRRVKENSDISPKRRTVRSPKRKKTDESPHRKAKKSRWEISPSQSRDKVEKTLDGKIAGLRSAQELEEESVQIRKREQEIFKSLPNEMTGASANTVFRDRKTGKVRDLEKEAKEKQQKEAEEKENVEKYNRWGMGLKQVEEKEKRAAEMLHEMSKPLTRYANDDDLEKHLKERECTGDPMLAYMRAKKRKEAIEEGHIEKPQYMGEFMPNRYGIRPDHRWDGVDRSNGYEMKYFESKNKKKAHAEGSYKWST